MARVKTNYLNASLQLKGKTQKNKWSKHEGSGTPTKKQKKTLVVHIFFRPFLYFS